MRRILMLISTLAALVAIMPGAAPTATTVAPPPPAGATGIALDGSVELAWQPVGGATAYSVYRGTSAGAITTRLTPAAGIAGTTYADTTAVNGTTYYYAVRSLGGVGGAEESGPSLTVQATPRVRSCSTGNTVVLENCFPGSPGWPATNVVTPESGGIEGFATANSINKGQSVDLKVRAQAGSTFRVEVYRNGYYGGAGARLFSTILGVAGSPQTACINDGNTGLLDCSNWSTSTTLTTTTSWPSGVYLLRLVREDTGRDNHILLSVRDDGRNSDILFGTSVATYQAYNNYGGRSLYDFNSVGPPTVAGTERAVKVSFDRPYNQARVSQRDWYPIIDYPWVFWLERSGYDVAYVANTDLERSGALVRNHRAYVSPSHDEYWSAAMRGALRDARDAGTGLFFGGGNQVYWKVRFENSPFSGSQDRVLVCYKSTQSGGPDPSGIPTGTWRDPAGANDPENGLAGVMYVGDNENGFFPLRVSAAEGADRIYRYTPLNSQPPGTFTNVGSEIVGWEWDARINNGREPPGVVTLASTPVTGSLLQDAGRVYAPGSTTVHVTKYTAASGALVFATGTNHWVRGLATNASGVGEPDLRIQQVTTNVFQDMGIRPQTPAANIVLDETGTPTVTATSPTNGATGVSLFPTVRATFSRTMDPATITTSSFTLRRPDNTVVPASVSYDGPSRTATLTPSASLALSTTYTARLETTIRAVDGTPLASPVTWTFTTTNQPPPPTNCPCTLFPPSAAPASQDLDTRDGRPGTGPWTYELGVKVTVDQPMQLTAVRFWKSSQETGTHIGRVWTAGGSQLAQVTFTGETASGWQEQRLASGLSLQPNTVYIISVNANTRYAATISGLATQVVSGPLRSVADGLNGVYGDAAGVFPTQSYSSTNYFVDLEVSDAGPPPAPTVTAQAPASGATGVSLFTTVRATFSRAMDAATITTSSFTLRRPDNSVVPASVTYDSGTRTATLTPSSALTASTTYTARLETTIRASDGVALANPVTWSFTTTTQAPPPPDCPCTLFSPVSVPAQQNLPTQDGRSGTGPWSYELGVKVTVDQPMTLRSIRFWKSSLETGTHIGRVWTVGGTQLAQVTFTGETASGWQQQALTSPLSLQPDVVYVISVNANAYFSATQSGLATQVVSGPLRSVADGQNGVFGSAAGVFPNQSYQSSNYFVDLEVIAPGAQPAPTVTSTAPASGATGVSVATTVRATFSRSMDPATINASSFTLRRPDSSTVPAAVTYDATSRTATLTPNSALAFATTYTARLETAIRAADGTPLASPVTWSFATANQPPPPTSCPCTLFSPVLEPASQNLDTRDGRPEPGPWSYELGVKVTVDQPMELSAIRFWKSSLETGTHVGRIWTAGGTQLAQVTFTSETASGWQQQALASPVSLQPDTVYVISVNANTRYAVTGNGLQTQVVSGPLRSVADGQNGVFASSAGLFPNQSFNSSNYFVDLQVVSPGSGAPTGSDTTPPTVAMSSPSGGATVSGTTTVAANASDNVGVAGVQFKLDGNNLGAEDTSAPYSTSWDTTGASNGSHTLTAVARDAAGNATTSNGITVTVNNSAPGDTTAPTVSITAPSGGSTVSGTTSVQANASDNVGVAGVQFKVDGNNVGAEDTSAPYAVDWNTTGVSNGSHTVTAVARDAAGNQTTSSGVAVTVNNTPSDSTPPTVSITAPADGATVSGTTNLQANASDNVGVAGVQFKLDGNNLGAEDTTAPYAMDWNTAAATNGAHTLTAVARDAAGNQTTSSGVTVTVNNSAPGDTTPPTVSVTAPSGGATVSGSTTVAADASDNVGVTAVQFRLDGSDLGAEDTSAPYSISWDTTSASNGSHTLTAIARDAAGNQTTSSGVTVTVNNSTPGDTTAPSVSITAPNGGSTVSGSTTVSADASDNVGVAGVQFRLDGNNLGAEDTSAPYSISWDTTGASNGSHTLTAIARDAAGNQTTSSGVPVTVNNAAADTTPPTVSVTAPAAGAQVSGTVSLQANASDNVGVVGVQFKVDGNNVGAEDTAAPYAVDWDTTPVGNGSHSVTAVARDAAGNQTTSNAVAVTVANPLPNDVYNAFVTDPSCLFCAASFVGPELEARIQGGRDDRDTAYGLRDFGGASGFAGRVWIRDVVRLAPAQSVLANLTVFQVRDVNDQLVYEVFVRANDRSIRITSPAGGLRATAYSASTGVVLPNDGITSRRVEVSALANDSIEVRVDGVTRITASGFTGATTGAQRYLRAGIDHYDGSSTAQQVLVYHRGVNVSEFGWLGAFS